MTLHLTAAIDGDTTQDLADALDEIKSKVLQDYTSGMDRNASGSYSFGVDDEEGAA